MPNNKNVRLAISEIVVSISKCIDIIIIPKIFPIVGIIIKLFTRISHHQLLHSISKRCISAIIGRISPHNNVNKRIKQFGERRFTVTDTKAIPPIATLGNRDKIRKTSFIVLLVYVLFAHQPRMCG